MSSVASSPEKTKRLSRTTYAGRMKKDRQEKQKAQSPSEEIDDSEEEDEETRDGNKLTEGSGVPPSTSKQSSNDGIFAVPETPTRVSQKPLSSASSAVSTGSSKHGRTGSTPSAKMKPPSSRASKDSTENISDTESTADGKQRRKRKSEAERIQFFKDDPWCKELEPHRILCSQCSEWQELHPKRKYVMQAWVTHRKTCPGVQRTTAQSQPVSQTSTPLIKSTPLKLPPSTNATDDSLGPMEAEGKATLENDFRTGEIRPHEVFCTQCATWVKLYPSTKYSPRNWLAHVQQCTGPETSSSDKAPASVPDDASSTAAVPSTPALSEKTRADSEASPSLAKKRARTDSDVEEEPVSPRVVRPRTDSYRPSLGAALWNMVTKPVMSFIHGFKHGMNPEVERHDASTPRPSNEDTMHGNDSQTALNPET